MFPFLPSSEKRRAAVRFAGLPAAVCLLAVCLCAVAAPEAWAWEPYVHDAAPGQVPKNDVRSSDDPCPDNITPETWSQSSTLWRWVYRTCKPEGAPERYAYKKQDMEPFFREGILLCTELKRNDYDLTFDEWGPNVCRITMTVKKRDVNIADVQYCTKLAVWTAVEFFSLNGRSPGAESMLIAVRAVAENGSGVRNMYSIYDPETGAVLFRPVYAWE